MNASAMADTTRIKYLVKTNRYGRRILDSPNVIPSLWPTILSLMTNRKEAAMDALFYFVREYFSRQPVHPQQQPGPPQKKAKLYPRTS
jgi:hypothetical protein